MSNTIAIEIRASSLTAAEFRRLLRWCFNHGATEFTIAATGSGGDGSHVVAFFRPVRERLARFSLGRERRRAPLHTTWNVAKRELYRLSYDSIRVLSTIGLDRHFGASAAIVESGCTPSAMLHYLCLYRDGRPMLALFEEQETLVYVMLRREELEEFRAERFGRENVVYENYFPEYFE